MLSKKILSLAKRALEVPSDVLFFRLEQAVNLELHHSLNLWEHFARKSRHSWSLERSEALKTSPPKELLIDRRSLERLRLFFQEHPSQEELFRQKAMAERGGHLEIFGQKVDVNLGDIQWNEDWRNGYRWENKYFRDYDHYDFEKTLDFDVKFPWELSRLKFLMLPTLFAALDDDEEWWETLGDILQDFIEKNPYAHSVNWNPMECAMRSLNLVQLAMLHLASSSHSWRTLANLLHLCDLHGHFLWRTLEYTDVRGNHYAANLVALYFLSTLLSQVRPEARKWQDYALEHLDEEVLLQFSSDGVQFEKSIPYHRLVTQLFLLGMIARKKTDLPIDARAQERLKKACSFTDAYLRPDHRAPMWGDNDDATAFAFSSADLRDHRDLLGVAMSFFDDFSPHHAPLWQPECSLYSKEDFFEKLANTEPKKNDKPKNQLNALKEGGMIIAENENYHFLCDVGDIGLKGRGGHGHHDALSFELSLNGRPLIVDRGSFIYTGNPQKRNEYRRTASHNVLQVDGFEMGSFDERNFWRLGNEARPYGVSTRMALNGVLTIEAAHDGYKRLPDPVSYRRRFVLFPSSRFQMIDFLFSYSSHDVKRFFHFEAGLALKMDGNKLLISTAEKELCELSWAQDTKAELVEDRISPHYGVEIPSQTLILSDAVRGETELYFTITY